jgi:hypothetical protein
MTLISLTDCCHFLAIDAKTLRRWMSLSGLSALPHPTDARLKCVTREQVLQLAAAHRRTLPDDLQAEISAPATPTGVLSAPVLSDVPPDFSALVDSLTTQMSFLQAHIGTLQHQLTHLREQLRKEKQLFSPRQEESSQDKSPESSLDKSLKSSLDKSLESSLDKSLKSSLDKSLKSSLDKSLESSLDKSSKSSLDKSLESSQGKKESARAAANISPIDRRKHPHVLPLVEYGAQGKYVVICPERGLLDFEPDSPEWFAWLSPLLSFRFIGQHGRLTVYREVCLPTRGWRGSRRIRNRAYHHSLGKTDSLTIAELELAAAALQAHLN